MGIRSTSSQSKGGGWKKQHIEKIMKGKNEIRGKRGSKDKREPCGAPRHGPHIKDLLL